MDDLAPDWNEYDRGFPDLIVLAFSSDNDFVEPIRRYRPHRRANVEVFQM